MIARGEGQGAGESISLDVHAIAELKEKGVPTTNDAFKYNYVADENGCYSEFDSLESCNFVALTQQTLVSMYIQRKTCLYPASRVSSQTTSPEQDVYCTVGLMC